LLHRAELTALERSEQIAEWARITESISGATCATKPGAGQGSKGGVRAASRELGLDRTEVQRSIKIAGLSAEAKEAARDVGLDDNRSALLKAARVAPERQADVRSFFCRPLGLPLCRCFESNLNKPQDCLCAGGEVRQAATPRIYGRD
jgi:hypothetical protein